MRGGQAGEGLDHQFRQLRQRFDQCSPALTMYLAEPQPAPARRGVTLAMGWTRLREARFGRRRKVARIEAAARLRAKVWP